MYIKTQVNHLLYLEPKDQLIIELEAEIKYLRNLVSNQADIIAELQCRIDPYSSDGEAICNSFYPENNYMND